MASHNSDQVILKQPADTAKGRNGWFQPKVIQVWRTDTRAIVLDVLGARGVANITVYLTEEKARELATVIQLIAAG